MLTITVSILKHIDFVTQQMKQDKPGGGGGVYLHTTPTSSEW